MFKAASVADRWELVQTSRLCFNCLRPSHSVKSCSSKSSCKNQGCNQRHHTLLCQPGDIQEAEVSSQQPTTHPVPEQPAMETQPFNEVSSLTADVTGDPFPTTTILPSAINEIRGMGGTESCCRCEACNHCHHLLLCQHGDIQVAHTAEVPSRQPTAIPVPEQPVDEAQPSIEVSSFKADVTCDPSQTSTALPLVGNETREFCCRREACNQCHHMLLCQHGDIQGAHAAEIRGQLQPANPVPEQPVKGTRPSNEISSFEAEVTRDPSATGTVLPAAVIEIPGKNSTPPVTRAMDGPCSGESLINETCTTHHGLNRSNATFAVTGVASTQPRTTRGMVHLEGASRSDDVVVLKRIASTLEVLAPPCQRFVIKPLKVQEVLPLVDLDFNRPGTVDDIHGVGLFLRSQQAGQVTDEDRSPVARNSSLGWLVPGEVPAARVLTRDEKLAPDIFNSTARRLVSDKGRLVRLPPDNTWPALGDSLGAAIIKRLHQMERQLLSNPSFKQSLTEFMMKRQQVGHTEQVPLYQVDKHSSECFYLPHHASPDEEGSTTTLRVVFDGPRRTSFGVPLNDRLLVGPINTEGLIDVYCRFCTHPVVFVSDIDVYRQVSMNKQEADFQEIVWRDPDKPVQNHRLVAVANRTSSAAFSATKSLRQAARDSTEKHPAAAEFKVIMDVSSSNTKRQLPSDATWLFDPVGWLAPAIAAKTKVVPIQQVFVPRLEPDGAHLLTSQLKGVHRALSHHDLQHFAFTNSTIVLEWLSAHPRKWKTLVANRTATILDFLPRGKWYHVSSRDNPADCASRGITPLEQIYHPLWWTSPYWVYTWHLFMVEHYATPSPKTPPLEERQILSFCLVTGHPQNNFAEERYLLDRISATRRCTPTLATVTSFVYNLKAKRSKVERSTGPLTPAVLKAAGLLLRLAQHVISKDIDCLRNPTGVHRRCKLRPLYPFIDRDGTLRVGGRLQNASIPHDMRHPPILPQHHSPTLSTLLPHANQNRTAADGKSSGSTSDASPNLRPRRDRLSRSYHNKLHTHPRALHHPTPIGILPVPNVLDVPCNRLDNWQ